ncbi:S9 family peptidase [Cryobacterium sp. PAMC25264]|uniref:alpha/beta hydrolase family protein n=1 Tax=Cryobacterium sp. PAMC25264 TaxID=2861288 RepID=UPI001C62D6F5|nr:alpha/beta hydrolase [Cryobacterium sp. PAMC25264]QYF72481.1 prolyl oligopeptidase family serine peptidase [Cryobacterium sp. PAMC25264]
MPTPFLRRNSFWLILSLALCLISAVGASFVQSNGATVAVTDMRWETSSGRELSALLYKPASATPENKAPVVIVSHGWWNSREMQDANYVELAKRGYVVVSIDMYGHGNSGPLPLGMESENGTGMYDAVKLVAQLPYIDPDKIGVSGHSNGARAANYAVVADNEAEKPLISAVLLVDNEAFYSDLTDPAKYVNNYGSRDVGLVADQYDEFFFRSYDANGQQLTPPREFIGTPNAQSFLHFGTTDDSDVRTADELYTETIDGTDALRVVYTPAQTHPWGPFSKQTTEYTIDFFQEAFGAPDPIPAGSQTWQLKAFFNALGLIGFGMFLVAFTKALLVTRAFAGLRRTEPFQLAPSSRKGLYWFWGALVVSALFSGWSYVALSQSAALTPIVFNAAPTWIPQGAPFFIGLWAAVNGVFSIVVMVVSYLLFGRKNGQNLREVGVFPGWKPFLHGLGLSAVVVVAAFGIVFVVDYFFKTDFRFWVLAVKAFTPDKVGIAFLYLPLFLVYYVANSVAINSFNRFTIREKEWVNTAILALFNSLAPLVLVIAQYWTFFVTGDLIPGFGGIFSIWLFPVIVILAASAVITRKIFRATNNPYIGGFIMAAVVTVISVTNTLTVVS